MQIGHPYTRLKHFWNDV